MEFTYSNYEKFLKTLKKDYEFISFSRAKYSSDKLERVILLRHDIDQSLIKAEKIIEIEASLGVSSTYFLFFKSPFYNIFSHREEMIIRKIIENNHYIGLHFDYSKSHYKTISQISYQINNEAEFLQDYFGVKVDSISFHRPFSMDFFNKLELHDFPHAYEKIFMEKFKYFSDSKGEWRFGNPLDSINYKNRENLHLLIHPIWWTEKEITALEKIKEFKENYINILNENLYNEMKGFWDSIKNEKE
jgi:hypothetical protein